tara:strand:+ start:1248 stop:1787 length:540 start_codon:yes stop_codon:yes gene_type:complete
MNKRILFCILSSAVMSGCASFTEEEVVKAPVPTYEPSVVSEKEVYDTFILAAKNVDESLRIYAEVNNAAKRDELNYEKIRQAQWNAQYVPEGLERPMTITWEGPIRPLISQLTKEVDYQVRFIGDLPPVPHTVSVVAKNKPIIEILRDINAKVDGLVDINIFSDSEAKIIEVKYVDRFK